ncbi:MAG: apolipoprotein N-acyltransferase, partial [Chrysiogenetes bacterium]|nr:apolipoprotein N-acyltransferase [Chrysiogenetes bacterium]
MASGKLKEKITGLTRELRTPDTRRQLGAAALSAVLCGLCISRLDPWPLEWVCLIPILWVLPELSGRRAFLVGWFGGFWAHMIIFRWLSGTVVRFSNLPPAMAILTLILFSLLHGLIWALWVWAAARLNERTKLPAALAAAIAYTVVVFQVWQLFPWFVGMGQHNFLPFAQIADIGGASLVSFVVVLANGVFTDALRQLRAKEPLHWKPLALVAGIVVLGSIYGGVRLSQVDGHLEQAEAHKVALVQNNIPILKKREVPAQEIFGELIAQVREAAAGGAELIVLAESSLPFRMWGGIAGSSFITADALSMGRDFTYAVQEMGVPVVAATTLAGLKPGEHQPYLTNSAVLLAPLAGRAPGSVAPGDLIAARYDKIGLLPFGEFMPLQGLIPQLRQWIRGGGTFTPGTKPASFDVAGMKLAAGICYEAILPAMTLKALRPEDQVLLNLTNDAWFGEGD